MTASSARLVVVGQGYVGLPLAIAAAEQGWSVSGLDTDEDVVGALNEGRSHVGDVSDAAVARALAAGYRATRDPACADGADAIVVCVPTPLHDDLSPDLGAVMAAADAIAPHLNAGALVVLESTTYPGTTDGAFRDALEAGSGLSAGADFALAFSPERIDPGNRTFGLRNTPKVVGGLTPACTARATAFYATIVETVVPTSSTREAELAKLIENTYRHVNIALINEIAVLCHELDIDVWAAIEAAATKPFGFQAFLPGPGVGGHCIPIDPNYLSYRARTAGHPMHFVELAHEVNSRMPTYVVNRVQDLLNRAERSVHGSRIAVVGLTYKPNVSDQRETPAAPIIRRLLRLGAHVIGIDPHVDGFTVDGQQITVADDPLAAAAACHLLVVLQHHAALDLDMMSALAPLVFDTRGSLQGGHIMRL